MRVLSSPKSVDIAITGHCNLACRYCYYADEMTGERDLDADQWLRFAHTLGRMGVMRTTLSGGEPFMRPDLFEIIDGFIHNRMRYGLLTNATLIDAKTLEKFKVGKRRLRLDSIQVSIDGSSAGTHNQSRPGSFERAVEGLKRLLAADFPVTVRVTINRHNLNDLEATVGLLLDDLNLPSISTNDAMPMGAGCRNPEAIQLSAAERQEAMDIMERLLNRYPGRLGAQAGPQALLKTYAEMEKALQSGEKTTSWKMGHLSSCGGVFSKLDVLHDGTIVPCSLLHGVALGNILADDVQEIWRSHPTLTALRQRRQIPMNQVPGCEDCPWAPYCSGSCPGLAWEATGDMFQANPQDCYRRFRAEMGFNHASG